ncbi:MAG: YncE family protein [Terriglobales bacterium]
MKNLNLVAMSLGLVAVAGLAAAQSGQSSPDGYHVAKTVSIPNPGGGWDYLGIDTPARRLYVSAGAQEDVINADTYQLEGTVSGLQGTHGVAISDRDGHGFTSNGGSNSMTEFSLKTLKTIKVIPLPIPRPDGIIYDPATDRIFAFNHAQKNALAVAVDAKTGKVAGTITLPSRAAEYAAADGRGHVFDNMEDSSQEIEIDAHTLKIIHTWPLAPCEGPSGLAIDAAAHRLFVGCHNKLMAIVNSDTGKVVATEPIGGGVDATRFDPGTKLAFSSNGSDNGSITVIHEDSPDSYTVVGNIPTQSGARTMEVDTQTHTLFTVTAKYEPRPPAPPASASAGGARSGRGRGRYQRRKMVPGSFSLLVIPKG